MVWAHIGVTLGRNDHKKQKNNQVIKCNAMKNPDYVVFDEV